MGWYPEPVDSLDSAARVYTLPLETSLLGVHDLRAPGVTGRPAKYCSPACRATAHRQRHNTPPAAAEVTMGSASSRGRKPDNAWTVQLHRANHHIIIAIGLRRPAADRLAQQINNLLTPNP